MGLVLAAMHLTLRQPVAIKLLLPSSLEDRVVVARFEREARAAAMLKSEHVARVLDVGHATSGSPYMVMELLDGSDLEQIVDANGPIQSDIAVNYVLQACATRSPRRTGTRHHSSRHQASQPVPCEARCPGEPMVKVLDFGILEAAERRRARPHAHAGRDGSSPLYMAPEQLRSAREVDVRADLWALGAILFRLITGRTPFDGETMAQLSVRACSSTRRRRSGR